jgi:acyl dehydratase
VTAQSQAQSQDQHSERAVLPPAGVPWDQVTVGDELPPLVFEVSRSTLAKDVVGTRDLYPMHHDHEFAQANGVRDIFLNTMWYQGLIGRYANEWGGYESFARKLRVQMNAHSHPGATLTVRGTVLGKSRDEAGRTLVELDVRIANGGRADAVVSRLTLELY